jgi:hypothetical protein
MRNKLGRNSIFLLASVLFLPLFVDAETVPFGPDRWIIDAKESRVLEYLGRPSLYLKGGTALVRGADMLNGMIQFDIAFSKDRGFSGAVWRVQDNKNYENFYVRPHQSGNPDSNQYTPVFNGMAGWQLYYGDEFSTPVSYAFNEWIPIKIVFFGAAADIYIVNMESPVLYVPELKHAPVSGMVGLEVSNFAPAYFSNFSYTPMKDVVLQGKPKPRKMAPTGTVKSLLISEAFPESLLQGKTQLTESEKGNLSWKKLECELSGIVNFARLVEQTKTNDTAFGKITIESNKNQIKAMQFGFSDRVRVYLNDRLLFSGNDEYQSRDYRFLGTVGLYDVLYLPLQEGKNELWMAVSEGFGGWGAMVVFENMDGIRIVE